MASTPGSNRSSFMTATKSCDRQLREAERARDWDRWSRLAARAGGVVALASELGLLTENDCSNSPRRLQDTLCSLCKRKPLPFSDCCLCGDCWPDYHFTESEGFTILASSGTCRPFSKCRC